MAVGAYGVARELFRPALRGGSHLAVGHLLQIFAEAVVGEIEVVGGACRVGRNAQLFGRAVEYFGQSLFADVLQGRAEVAVVFSQNGFYLPENRRVAIFPQGRKSALTYGELGIGDNLLLVDDAHRAQPFAVRARALRRIEREVVRRRLAVADARDGAHEVFGEIAHSVLAFRLCVLVVHHHQPVALREGVPHALAQPLHVLCADFEFVYHHLDVVVFVAVEFHALHRLAQFAVHAHREKAFLAHGLEEFLVMSLSCAHQRREQQHFAPFVVREQHVHDFLFRIFHHRLARHVAVGRGGAGEEQAQEVVDFGNGAHGGARVAVGGLLLDADYGTEAAYLVHVGAIHAIEKVAGVGREGLDIAALAFGINRVEGQRTLTAAAKAGNHAKAVARQGHVDVFQVMLSRTDYIDVSCRAVRLGMSFDFVQWKNER